METIQFDDVETIDLNDDFHSYHKSHLREKARAHRDDYGDLGVARSTRYVTGGKRDGPQSDQHCKMYELGFVSRESIPEQMHVPAAARIDPQCGYWFWRGWSSGRLATKRRRPSHTPA